jgi:predicted porin
MKKTLVAVAALTAAAGAFAQSTVTLFGVLDTSVAHISSGNSKVTGLASGGVSSSRLGFRGTEDLGGGLAAGFWLVGGLAVDNGNSSGYAFERRSTVSLSSNAIGELRLGRDKAPAYLNIETFDPFGDVGVGGVNGSNLVGSATSAAGTAEGSAPKRASNSINYLLPATLGGFYGQVQYAFGEQIKSPGITKTTEIDYRATNVGASYNFGFVKPMVLIASERGNGRRVDLYEVGATVPVGAGEIRAAYSMYKRKDISDADSNRFALGYGYNLSKRTQLYATVARVDNDDRANRGLTVSSSSLASPTIAAGRNVTGYEFGIRHSF